MDILSLFTQLPDCIRNKIIVYYLGFGTPISNLFNPQMQIMNSIKRCSTVCTDDFTLWRYKIAKTQKHVMTVESSTFSGYIALCELTIAYNQSNLYKVSRLTRAERIYQCEMAIEAYGIIPTMI